MARKMRVVFATAVTLTLCLIGFQVIKCIKKMCKQSIKRISRTDAVARMLIINIFRIIIYTSFQLNLALYDRTRLSLSGNSLYRRINAFLFAGVGSFQFFSI